MQDLNQELIDTPVGELQSILESESDPEKHEILSQIIQKRESEYKTIFELAEKVNESYAKFREDYKKLEKQKTLFVIGVKKMQNHNKKILTLTNSIAQKVKNLQSYKPELKDFFDVYDDDVRTEVATEIEKIFGKSIDELRKENEANLFLEKELSVASKNGEDVEK